MQHEEHTNERSGEQGLMLVGLVVAIFLILLAMSVAAPTVAKELRREQEVETVHRGNQYVQAIRRYYKVSGGQYPGTIDQLEKTNNIRCLRQKYVDPITGKVDWRLIKVGEAKTTVKGFFGKPLGGINSASMGSGLTPSSMGSSGMGASAPGASTSGIGGSSSSFGSSSSSGFGSSSSSPSSSSSFGGSSSGFGSSSGSGSSSFGSSSSGTPGSTGTSGSSGNSSSSTSTMGGGAPFVGVGLSKQGDAIVVVNEQTTYQTWEFLYDPRIEQLKAQAALQGGSNPNSSMGPNTMGTPGSNGNGSPGSGSSPSSPFGSGSSSGNGSPSSSPFSSGTSSPTSGSSTQF